MDYGSVPGFYPYENDIDALRTEIAYSRYGLTNRAAYFETKADLSLYKLKQNVELLYSI